MAYNNPASWDGLTINDDSFLALLQKQIASANPSSLVLDPTRFPAPPADNPTPPLSEDSPSPPSIREKEAFMRGFDDEHSKRKAQDYEDSDDEILGQPQHKSQHRDSSSKKSGGRRKSGGGNPDETRLLKRKEQNRAAQRAFRERKEKHVKELEDKVAALESKNQNQDRENENLRDLLGRLQNENLLLKQSAFTFSFPGGAGSKPSTEAATSPAATSTVARQSASPKLPSPSSSSSASTPESVPEQSVYSSLFAGPSTAASSSASSSNSPRSEATTSRFQSSPADFNFVTDFNNVDFSNNTLEIHGGKPQYTTIAANPMYTSYSDPSFDPMTWGSFGSGDFSQVEPDLNLVAAGKSDFGGSGFSQPYGSNASAASMDDLFSQNSFVDYSGGYGGGPSSFASPPGISMSQDPSPSPVLHRTGATTEPSSTDDGSGCPKTREDIDRIIGNSAPSTFGPPVSPPIQRRESDEKDAAAHARMAALCADLPRTAKRPNQIEIGRAWEKVRQHPQFDECDVDELCNELSAKAKCDGSRPVLEESSFNDIVHALPGMKYKR